MSNKLMLASLLDENNQALPFDAAQVFDRDSKKSVKELIDSIQAKIAGLQGGEVSALKADLEALKNTFDTFMTGENDDNGALDRLKELVAAIQANKDSIDALLTNKATKEDLAALIERVSTLEADSHKHENKAVLDALAINAETKNLVFNGKELNGETGIAIGTSASTATDFTGKIKIVVEEIPLDEPVEEGA